MRLSKNKRLKVDLKQIDSLTQNLNLCNSNRISNLTSIYASIGKNFCAISLTYVHINIRQMCKYRHTMLRCAGDLSYGKHVCDILYISYFSHKIAWSTKL